MRPFAFAVLLGACTRATVWEPLDVKHLEGGSPATVRRVLLDAEELRFSLDPDTGAAIADDIEHVRVQALKADALPHEITRSFDRTFYGLPELHARVLFPDGTERELEPDTAFDFPISGGGVLFAEERALQLSVPIVPARAVLEYETRQRTHDLKALQYGFTFGGQYPVVQSRFEVVAPSSWELEWKGLALGREVPLEPTITDEGQNRRYSWRRENLDALPREPYGPDTWLEAPSVLVRLKKWKDHGHDEAAFATPRELSAWLYDKYGALAEPDDDMRQTVKQVIAPAGDDPAEKARRLYDYVCEHVQYCAIEVGYGGWFPHPAKVTHANKYGDCKDKANYLKALLDIAGVKSRPTLINLHAGFPRGFGLPSLAANFNHEILTIDLPGRSLLADPTARSVAFGDLPASDRESVTLPIQPGGGELSTAPIALPDEHVERLSVTLALGADGSATGSFELDGTGAVGADLRHRLLIAVPAKRGEAVSDWLAVPEAKVSRLGELTGLDLVPRLQVKGELKVPRLVQGDRRSGLFRLSSAAPRWLPALPADVRRAPLVLPYRYHRTLELRVELPQGVTATGLPKPFEKTSKWFDYKLEYSVDGHTLVARRELTLKERIVPSEELGGLRERIEGMLLAESAPVLLEGR
jgi:transglutaminase-like putative cysteine protease